MSVPYASRCRWLSSLRNTKINLRLVDVPLASRIDVAVVGRDELLSTEMDTVELILVVVVMLETLVETARTDMVMVDFMVDDDVVGWVIDEVVRTLDTVVDDNLDVVDVNTLAIVDDDHLDVADDDHLDVADDTLATVVETAFTVAELDVQPGW
jgi:hypothetical protein